MAKGNLPYGGGLLAQRAFIAVTALFGLAVTIQVFLAGEAALVAPEEWQVHVAWVHIFQWLSVALPPLAFLASRRLGFTVLNGLPMLVIGLQYVLIHRSIGNVMPVLAGLHAVNGLLLIAFAVYIVQGWWQRASPPA